MWSLEGDPRVQAHYRQGRGIKEVLKSDIEGICECGYLSLKPQCDFENRKGGLTVKRSKVTIVNEDGNEVKRLSRKGINTYYQCNACVNHWC